MDLCSRGRSRRATESARRHLDGRGFVGGSCCRKDEQGFCGSRLYYSLPLQCDLNPSKGSQRRVKRGSPLASRRDDAPPPIGHDVGRARAVWSRKGSPGDKVQFLYHGRDMWELQRIVKVGTSEGVMYNGPAQEGTAVRSN